MFLSTIKKVILSVIGATLALTLAACGGSSNEKKNPEWPDTITFASIPSESSTTLAKSFETTVKMLEKELGLKVEVQEVTSYAAVIEALRAGQVGIGALGPFSYVVAADGDAGVKPFGAVAESPDAKPSYTSLGITKANSQIASLKDFKGKKICFVDPTSTSGFLFPSAGLLQEGIDPDSKDITKVMAGGHDSSALSVADGTCDAGFVSDPTMKTLIEKGQIDKNAVKTVWTSEEIPGSPVVVSTQLPDDLQEEVTRVFREKINKPAMVEDGICDSEENCVLPEEGAYGYVPVEDNLYDGIRKVCDITQSESCVK